ncbi:MAG: hypothetical protein RLZZ322_378 [Verrucomicrobiota bacterium]|jgi:D-tyrosyl-tRNA(Tyr) deacylase
MRIVLQRVRRAGVARAAEPEQATTIGRGYVLLVGVAEGDDEGTARRLAADVAKVRLMEDDAGKLGRSLKDAGGEVLAVSQFTLLADFSKGNRPSFHRAARPEAARLLFDLFVRHLGEALGSAVKVGFFGEDMRVEVHNDGPVTVVLE